MQLLAMAYSPSKFLLFSLFLFFFNKISQAQVVPDNTLPQNSTVNPNCTNSCQIDGGTTRGSNLFHSFEEFSVPADGEAIFSHESSIENIFTRVTGSSMSEIEGTIRTQIKDDLGNQGSANLFLINPNGIMFGANAQLNIGGSFLATTADSIFFENDLPFSVINPKTSPLLTVSVPIGLQFGKTPGEIINKSRFEESIGLSFLLSDTTEVGIKVNDGKTIALLGSGVTLDNSFLTAFEGRVELGSVAANSFVDLTQDTDDLILSYDSVNKFEKISINESQILTNSLINLDLSKISPSGNIQIYGNEVNLLNDSSLFSANLSNLDGGNILIEAETVTVQDSRIITTTRRNGNAGNVIISAHSVNVLEIIQDKEVTGLFSQTLNANGKAGSLNINTNNLTIQDGAQISVTTFGKGEGGNLIVNSSESVEVIGRAINGRASGLFAQSQGINATGDAGNLQINTGKLIVGDGGRISVGAIEDTSGISQGNGGELIINTSESVEVTGFGKNEQGAITPSTLLSESQGIGNAGNLEIATPQLIVTNQGEVNVSATGTGEAGSLTINAQDIILDRGILNAETNAGDKGNITIANADTLLLRNSSNITTNATEQATGGNITINSEGIALLDNSAITANAVEGRGGDINITTKRLFQEPDSKITATSKENIDGTVTINSTDVDPTSGLIELPNVPIDAVAILAKDLCKFEDDKIAGGSSFIITGTGGITPTAAEPLENLNSVVRWLERDNIKVSKNGLVAVRQRSESDTAEKNYPVIEQAQGWVTTSDGSVLLVANPPETIPTNSGVVHPDCRALRQQTR